MIPTNVNPDYNPHKYSFLKEKGHIISVVGAGGKTSWIKTMALFCAQSKMKVLVTTTTHQGMPDDGSFVQSIKEADRIWESRRFVTLGKLYEDPKSNVLKLKAPDDDILKEFIKNADITFIESDGSRHKPIKAPACYEPVILKESDIVIGVVGMHALGKTVGEVGFRLNELTKLLRCDLEHVITEEDIDKVINSPDGLKKSVEGRLFIPVKNHALIGQNCV